MGGKPAVGGVASLARDADAPQGGSGDGGQYFRVGSLLWVEVPNASTHALLKLSLAPLALSIGDSGVVDCLTESVGYYTRLRWSLFWRFDIKDAENSVVPQFEFLFWKSILLATNPPALIRFPLWKKGIEEIFLACLPLSKWVAVGETGQAFSN